MPILGKKFPAPVGKPMMPFLAAGVIMAFAISKMQTAMANSDEFKHDPRNPNRQIPKPGEKH